MFGGRRALIGLLAVVMLLAAGTGPAQASTTLRFEATFSEFVSESLCGSDWPTFCGTGVVAQFDSASIFSTGPLPNPDCTALSLRRELTITVAGGTLRLCQLLPVFTVIGGTGVFAGASGGGTASGTVQTRVPASCIEPLLLPTCHIVYSGTLTLP
jgi:hypothetical protein